MVLTTEASDFIDNKLKLAGYPRSHFFTVGYELKLARHSDAAIDAFKRGVDSDGCVPCMVFCVIILQERGKYYLLLPYAFEGAIRGQIGCMNALVDCYQKQSQPASAMALSSLWTKIKIELGDTDNSEVDRKRINKTAANNCYFCGREDLEDNDVTIVKCGICKYYSYCGKNCQTRHWKEGQHMNECRQVILLRKYCKPQYVKEIREAIIGGQDPKEIRTLQRLRMKIGLNRPKEEYEELLLSLANDDINNKNNNNTMKRGTKVKVKGLVKASQHNGKFGIVTKASIPGVSIPGEAGGSSRVGVKLSDENGTVLSIKIENLEPTTPPPTPSTTTNRPNNRNSNNTINRPNPLEYLIARKDGTVHIGSTANII